MRQQMQAVEKGGALRTNTACSLITVLGDILCHFFLQATQTAIPFALTLAASSFISIAIADVLSMRLLIITSIPSWIPSPKEGQVEISFKTNHQTSC
jgi:hypothetical protein